MAKLELTQGQFAQVSDHRYADLIRFKWHAAWRAATQTFYACRCLGKGDTRKKDRRAKQQRIYLHRYILGLEGEVYDPKRKAHANRNIVVDHINGDTLDCRDENIRIVDRSTNGLNRKPKENRTSGHRGVSWDLRKQLWRASKYYGKRLTVFGFSPTISEAVEIRRVEMARIEKSKMEKTPK